MGTPAQRHRWRPRRRRDRGNARRAAGTGPAWDEIAPAKTGPGKTAPGDTVAAAVQLAIGLLTASLDSPARAGETPRAGGGTGRAEGTALPRRLPGTSIASEVITDRVWSASRT